MPALSWKQQKLDVKQGRRAQAPLTPPDTRKGSLFSFRRRVLCLKCVLLDICIQASADWCFTKQTASWVNESSCVFCHSSAM